MRATIILGLAATGIVFAGTRLRRSRAVRQAFQAWSTGEGSIYDLMDADTKIVIPGIAAHCGIYLRDVFLRDVAGPFAERFATPPLPRLLRLWKNADSVAVLANATGTTRDARPYANTYVFVFEFAGRRVAEVTEFLDMAAFNAVWDRVEPAAAGAATP